MIPEYPPSPLGEDFGALPLGVEPRPPMQPEAPEPPPPPPPPQSIQIYPPPTAEFQEQAMDFFGPMLRASRAYVKAKQARWELLEDLYQNRLTLREWQRGVRNTVGTTAFSGARVSIADSLALTEETQEPWQSEFIYPIGDLIDKWAASAWAQIFEGAEFLTVLADRQPSSDRIDEPPQIQWGTMQAQQGEADFPLTTRLQALLLAMLSDGKIQARMREALTQLAHYGTVYCKVYYYERKVPRWTWGLETGQQVREDDIVHDAIILKPIDPAQLLPDPQAESDDIQNEWRFIGHRTERTYDEILWGYDDGRYNLNRKEFERTFSGDGGGPQTTTLGDRVHEDEDAALENDPQGRVQIWEVHGEVPTPKGGVECCCVIATNRLAEDPTSGVMIKLTTGPVNQSGLRPFVGDQFTPQPEPFGLGLVDRLEPVHYELSQSIAQFQDGVRLTCNPSYTCPSTSPAWTEIEKHKGTIPPGKILPVNEEDAIKPIALASFQPDVLLRDIEMLKGWIEAQTLTETFMGTSSREKTAMEATILQQQSQRPTQTITAIFADNFLKPLGKIALGWIQQMVLSDREIYITDANGQDIPVRITAEEIQSGRFRVVPTLTRNDTTKIAKAQAVERMIPILMQAEPHLNQEGAKVLLKEVVKRWVDLIGVDGADRIIQIISSEEQFLRDTVAQLQQQVMQLQQELAVSQRPNPAGSSHPPKGGPDQSGPPPSSPPEEPPPPQFPQNGGPMGPVPDDANVMADLYKEIQRRTHQPDGEGAP